MPDIVISSPWRDRLDRVIGGRREALLSVGVLVVTVIIATALWSRGAPAKIAPPARAPAAAATPVSGTGTILVHVAGAVKTPGLYELAPDTRVADAIEAAGGPLRSADLDLLNLAETLGDGAKIDVLERGDAPATVVPSPGASAGPVDVNAADTTMLETIPGIGPVRAAAIVDYRDANGPFATVEELIDVQGIGPATLESLRPYVTV